MNQIPKFTFGFNKNVEIINGRLAMITFVIVFLIELFFKQPLLNLFGLIN